MLLRGLETACGDAFVLTIPLCAFALLNCVAQLGRCFG